MKQLEHELPGVASLHGGLKRNEGVGSEQIAFHPDTHTFSIIPGRKPALTISSVTDSTDILLAATPQMLVGNITQALLSRQKITDPTTTLVLAQKVDANPSITVTLDLTNTDVLLEQLLMSDLENYTRESGQPVFGEITRKLFRGHVDTLPEEQTTQRENGSILKRFFTTSPEPIQPPRPRRIKQKLAQKEIENMSDASDLTRLRGLAFRLFWGMMGDQYTHAYDSIRHMSDKQGNQWAIMVIEQGDQQIRIRHNYTDVEYPILIGRSLFNDRLVANLYIETDGDLFIEGVDGGTHDKTTDIAAYNAYSIEEIREQLPVLVASPIGIIASSTTTDYARPDSMKKGKKWKPTEIAKYDLTIDSEVNNNPDRVRVYIRVSNQEYTSGTLVDPAEGEETVMTHSRVVIGRSGKTRKGSINAVGIKGLTIHDNDGSVSTIGCRPIQ